MKLKYLNIFLSKKFRQLGLCVGNNPSYFIVIPMIVSVVLATGLHKWHEETSVKYLIAPKNTRHVTEEASIESLFPMNLSSDAYMERMNREPNVAVVLVKAKDEGSVLRRDVFQEIIQLDKTVQNIKTAENFTYKDLCARNNKRCFENSILLMQNEIEMMENNTYSIKYPLSKKDKYDFQLTSLFLGGVEKNADDYVKSAKVLRLVYYFNDYSKLERSKVEEWQNLFLDLIESSNFQYIIVDRYTSITIEQELSAVVSRIFPRIPIAMLAIAIFSMLTCLYNSWIESKPWTGIIALTSGGMSLASSFGLIMYFNTPFVAPAGSIPFLIIGVAMDDAFVFLAAWKRTDYHKTVADRLSEVYSESAISVTVTSVTNFIAFISGLFTPFRAISYFCLYASISVLFCYVYQITFVGACMALFGYVEKQGRHSLFFTKINTQTENHSWIRKILFTTPRSSIWTKLGNILFLWYVMIIILFIMAGYVAVGVWGVTKTDTIGSLSDSSAYDSYHLQYHKNVFRYFKHYENRIQIVVDQEINYADVEIQNQIENLFSEMVRKGLIADFLTESWLRSFLKFVKDDSMVSIVKSYNMSDTKDFIVVLRRMFLRHPYAQRFRNDIAFNSDYTAIVGSRFLCQTNFTIDEKSFYVTLQRLRKITDKMPFRVFPYYFLNYAVDSIDLRIKFTVQLLCSIVLIVIFVCFVFMPDVVVTFSVTLSIVTIEISTLGYMAFWDVELAPVSIIVLVMCAGFSVDYSAHMSHAYRHCDIKDSNERLRHSINCIGFAIFQGSATTIISVLPLTIPLAYIFVTIFKIIFLVIMFSFITALVFLPVILSTLNYMKSKMCERKKRSKTLDHKVDGQANFGYQSSEICT
ncbi:patched domain-containing protein 3-like isoform X1 [Centruroides sculpturatus]|uniref:patched domain-containing protein 3-like isoform X1 n=1 Tax=Centruroides sculpturatus TaxID=218467 RepID=UPI000C6E25CA|nr:patched domain-containing protein 3-like isoform X1 [Centruroides sculpturatus]